MKDEIFDKYLADILSKKDTGAEKPAAEVLKEPPASSEDLSETARQEELEDFAEKTIRLSSSEAADFSKVKRAPATAPEKEPEQKPRKKKVRKANYSAYGGLVLATLVLCTSVIISLFVIVVGRDFLGLDTNNNSFTLYIESGWNVPQIADYLAENGIIEYPEVFTQFAKLKLRGGGAVYPGDIDVEPSMSYWEIIDLLSEAREAHETVTVTFIEGITLYDAAELLEENGVCDAEEFIFAFNNNVYGLGFESRVSSSSLKFYKYEGYLFPDTYEFYVGDSVYNIVKKIKEHTDSVLSEDIIARATEMNYTLDQVITMASLLQLESGNAEEMKNIAAVFYNRLNNPGDYPRLQSNATDKYVGFIKSMSSISYQEMYDAYDTYVCTGLPVGPVCNPGLAAIEAALYPAENSYYYFCSDQDGKFYYAETYEEQLANQEAAGIGV